MDKGGREYKDLWKDSNPTERTRMVEPEADCTRLFIPAYESLEGFFDKYGNAVVKTLQNL